MMRDQIDYQEFCRLVLWIAKDPIISHATGVFTATFLYALTSLACVDRSGSGRVPLVGIVFLDMLLIISIIMFIGLIPAGGQTSGHSYADSPCDCRKKGTIVLRESPGNRVVKAAGDCGLTAAVPLRGLCSSFNLHLSATLRSPQSNLSAVNFTANISERTLCASKIMRH